MLIEWLRASQRGAVGEEPAVVRPALETGGGNMVERPVQIRPDRRTAARARTGSGLPTVLEPPAA